MGYGGVQQLAIQCRTIYETPKILTPESRLRGIPLDTKG